MSRGFTLIELLYALTVLALVLAVGAPSFQSAVQNSRMSSSVNNMIATLQMARSEAIKRRQPVKLCVNLEDDDSCDAGDSDTDVFWHEGWMVFTDPNDNDMVDTGEQVIRREGKMPKAVRVSTPSGQSLQVSLSYLPSGFPDLGGLDAAGVLVFCDGRASNHYGRIIAISQTGRPLATTVDKREDLGETCE
ncbi:MAG: GspH/FimT family pseudopilin [Gammaproteobacteria bacterium]|nr:GspH/FimT family pseudopilin [Gammaproteobacteria bacterium]